MAVDFGFDFHQEMDKIQVEFASDRIEQQKFRQAQELMHLIQMGDAPLRQIIGENPWLQMEADGWLTEAKKLGIESPKKKPAEKIETPPGKRKIIL